MLKVQLAEAHANVAATESREIAMAEALKEAKDWPTPQLEDAYLVTRAKRRTLDTERQEPWSWRECLSTRQKEGEPMLQYHQHLHPQRYQK